MTIKGIQKKLKNMTKSQLDRLCRKIKCSKGTKKTNDFKFIKTVYKEKIRKEHGRI